jgi:hypothetical protein
MGMSPARDDRPEAEPFRAAVDKSFPFSTPALLPAVCWTGRPVSF